METLQLKDEKTFPAPWVLRKALGTAYAAYVSWSGQLAEEAIDLTWKYYRDGSAWLGKAVYRQKTVCWLSVWDAGFKVAFYFTEKTAPGAAALKISGKLKRMLENAKPAGKLIPLTVLVRHEKQIADLITLARYKRSLK